MLNVNRLLLVDGSSYLYRAFHAMADLQNSSGLYTGALYGLTSMLRKLRQSFPSTYYICVFDAGGLTFRHELYPQYKANRSSMPENLVSQLQYVDTLVQALGWPIIKIKGVEADDIIGTLAKQAKEHMSVLVATGDKDMAQLVDNNVHLIDTMKDLYLDIDGVQGKFEILPEQIVDYLSLMGDTSDNVPGIEKVGPKTAVKWLKQYQNLDTIVANAANISGVVGQNLRNSLEWLPMAKKLVTIDTNCIQQLDEYNPNWHNWRNFEEKSENIDQLKELFTIFEFKGWLKQLQEVQPNNAQNNNQILPQVLENQPSIKIDSTSYKTITSLEQLQQWLEIVQKSAITSFDTETTSINPWHAELIGISMAVKNNDNELGTDNLAVYIPIADHLENKGLSLQALGILKPWLENSKYKKVGHNIKYDLHVLRLLNINVQGLDDDIMLASYVLASHYSHNLDDLSRRYLQHQTISYESICGKGANSINFNQVDLAKASTYAAEDADITLHLYNYLTQELQKNHQLYKLYKNIECPIAHVLLDIEANGMLIDKALLLEQSIEMQEQIQTTQQKIFAISGVEFNINSPGQLAEILFNKLGLPIVKKTAGGKPSTDEEVLAKLAHDHAIAHLLLEQRSLSKLKNTYTDKLPLMVNINTGRIHTSFAQAVAITGRLSSNEPNLQNIPIKNALGRRIRKAFIASPEHCLISADYSQIELRIMAHISKDEGLLEAFTNNEDVHSSTAKRIFNIVDVNPQQRRYAKMINFGLIYGMSAFGLANNLGVDNKTAQNYIDEYFKRYPKVAQYMQNTRIEAGQQGYVETILGRRLYLKDINSNVYNLRQASERAAINAPIQGSAADIIKLAMLNISKYLTQNQLTTKIILQVHDELILEAPYHELAQIQAILPSLMQNIAELSVQLIVNLGVGDNWDIAH